MTAAEPTTIVTETCPECRKVVDAVVLEDGRRRLTWHNDSTVYDWTCEGSGQVLTSNQEGSA